MSILARNAASVLIFMIDLTVAAHAESGSGIKVRDAWSRATPPGIEVGVAYLVIDNRGKSDRLLGASAPIATRAELHVTLMENGMVTMRHLDGLDIKAGASTKFAPGGRHVMLIGLKRSLKDGDTFPLTLTFENAGPVHVDVHVFGIGKTPDLRR